MTHLQPDLVDRVAQLGSTGGERVPQAVEALAVDTQPLQVPAKVDAKLRTVRWVGRSLGLLGEHPARRGPLEGGFINPTDEPHRVGMQRQLDPAVVLVRPDDEFPRLQEGTPLELGDVGETQPVLERQVAGRPPERGLELGQLVQFQVREGEADLGFDPIPRTLTIARETRSSR